MNIIVLNSGSNGNAVYVESRESGDALLLDCGLTRRQIEARLKVHGRFPDRVKAVVVTHEHADHVRGLATFRRGYRVPVFLTEETLRGLDNREHVHGTQCIANTGRERVGDLTVRFFPKSHDAADPVMVLVERGEKRFLYATDLGMASADLVRLLPAVDALLLETNFDPVMLRDGNYPDALKRRVASDVGHLSNLQAMDLVERHCNGTLRALICGHLSANNNRPELVREAVTDMTRRKPEFRAAVHIASRTTVGDLIEL